MNKFRILRNIFTALALILSHVMCADVAYSYASMLCAIEHKGFSASADTVFLFAVPYAILIIICVILALVLNKKAR